AQWRPAHDQRGRAGRHAAGRQCLVARPCETQGWKYCIRARVKAPTGDEKATDTFYKSTGPEIRPVDIAIQPGDGGWGIDLELVGYRKIIDRLYGYVSGFYLINPREQNSAFTSIPQYNAVRNLSV